MTEEYIVIDTVTDESYDGKPYKLVTAKSGATYRVSNKLKEKWGLLASNIPVRLIMDIWNNNPYVKDLDRCIDLTETKIAELSKPKRNLKDVSIEAQVAVKAVADMLNFGQAKVPDDIQELTFEWIRKALTEANK